MYYLGFKFRGIMEKNMKTTTVYTYIYIGAMEKKMDATT